MNARLNFALVAITTIVLAACSKTQDTLSSSTLYCYATASEVSSGGNTLNVALRCSGGVSPYTVGGVTVGSVTPSAVTGTTANFASTTALVVTDTTRTSFNGLSGTIAVSDYGTEDGNSDTAELTTSVTFTVGTTTGTTTGTGCTIAASTTAPAINQAVTFTITANLGTAPYTFTSFSPGVSGTLTNGSSYTSATQAQATVVYSAAGTQTASASVTDSTGTVRSCTTTVSVGGTGTGTSGVSCTVALSQNPISRYTGVYAVVTPYSSTNTATLRTITFPLASGLNNGYSQILGNNVAYLYFPNSGTWTMTFYVQDSYGVQGTCTATETVY